MTDQPNDKAIAARDERGRFSKGHSGNQRGKTPLFHTGISRTREAVALAKANASSAMEAVLRDLHHENPWVRHDAAKIVLTLAFPQGWEEREREERLRAARRGEEGMSRVQQLRKLLAMAEEVEARERAEQAETKDNYAADDSSPAVVEAEVVAPAPVEDALVIPIGGSNDTE